MIQMGEKCEYCLYSVVDTDGYRKCLLYGWIVGDNDWCTMFVRRFDESES